MEMSRDARQASRVTLIYGIGNKAGHRVCLGRCHYRRSTPTCSGLWRWRAIARAAS